MRITQPLFNTQKLPLLITDVSTSPAHVYEGSRPNRNNFLYANQNRTDNIRRGFTIDEYERRREALRAFEDNRLRNQSERRKVAMGERMKERGREPFVRDEQRERSASARHLYFVENESVQTGVIFTN